MSRRLWVIKAQSSSLFFVLKCLLYFAFFQELLGVLANNSGLTLVPRLIPIAKYVVIVSLFAILSMRIRKDKQFCGIFLLFIVLFSFYLILSGGSQSYLGFFTKMIVCTMAFFVGKHMRLNDYIAVALDNICLWLSIFTLATGIFDYFYIYIVTHDELIKTFNVVDYLVNYKEAAESSTGLPGNLYASFATGWMSVRRLAGFFFVPLTYAYFAVFLLYYQLEKRRWYLVIPLLLTITLTFTRAILIPIPVILLYHFTARLKPYLKIIVVCLASFLSLVLFTRYYNEILGFVDSYLLDSSGQVHMSAISSVNSVSIINMNLTEFGESEGIWWTVMKLGGVFGFIFLLMLVPFFRAAMARHYLLYTWITYLFTSIFSNQLFSPTSVLLFYFVLGIMNNRRGVSNVKMVPSQDAQRPVTVQLNGSRVAAAS